jgi:hypothetical protein
MSQWIVNSILIAFGLLGAALYALSIGVLVSVLAATLRGSIVRTSGFPFVGVLLVAFVYWLSPFRDLGWVLIGAGLVELALGIASSIALVQLRSRDGA